MKYLILTDLHGKKSAMDWINPLIKKENIDCVLFLGDAVASPSPAIESARMIAMIDAPKILAIPGNIDALDLPSSWSEGVEDLHGKAKEMDGTVFVGFGGSNPTIFGTPFEQSENEIKSVLSEISVTGMILMVHCPAYGRLDHIPGGKSVGSTAIAEIVKKYRPKVVLSGHIHEDFGCESVDGVIYVNPGPAMDGRCGIMTVDGDNIAIKVLNSTEVRELLL